MRSEWFVAVSVCLRHAKWQASGELLSLAVDCAERLLPAFNTPTKLVANRVNLRTGDTGASGLETSVADAGTYLLEFGAYTHPPILRRAIGLRSCV